MAGVLLQIFNEYGIQNRVGYFMADNHVAPTTASPVDDGQTTEETSTPLRWPHNQPLRTCIHHGQGCRKDSQGNGRSDVGRRSKEDWRALEKMWSTWKTS